MGSRDLLFEILGPPPYLWNGWS